MTTIAPLAPPTAPAVALATVKPVPAEAERSAAPPPMLGGKAVTETQATRRAEKHDEDRKRLELLEVPADPPPLKGLGIPGLHTALVGDFDKPDETQTAPQATPVFSETLNAVNGPNAPTVDIKR